MVNELHRGDLEKELVRSLGAALDRLSSIWEEIGIDHDQRNSRTGVVMVHMRNLLEEMVKEEESLKKRLLNNVQKYSEDLLRLTRELQLPTYEPEAGLSILKLERNLRGQVDNMSKEKHDRLKALRTLKEKDQHLCDILCSTPYYVPTGAVPSREQLKELEAHVKDLETEKERRQGIFKNFKQNIAKMLDDLEQTADTSFERDVLCEEDSFLLSTDNMKALKQYHDTLEQKQKENYSQATKLRERCQELWERLQVPQTERADFLLKNTGFKPKVIAAFKEEISRCEVLKLQNMQSVIEGTRKQLEEWWDKCYYSPEQRATFKHFFVEDYSEEALELHDQEVQKVRAYYEENREMLDLVARWHRLWADFMECERKANDPNRFFNRGCNLLKEEKARKKLERELPRVEQEIAGLIEDWEKVNAREFRVGGERFLDYIKKQWEDFKVQKETEKEQRHLAKVKQTEEEMLYGSKPVTTTPGKRRFAGTPAKTPNKIRKIDPQHALPSIASSDSSGASTISTTSSTDNSTITKKSLSHRSTLKARLKVANGRRPEKQLNDTNARTPGSSIRLGRSTVFHSPVTPRCGTKSKTPHKSYMTQPYPGSARRPLAHADNHIGSGGAPSNDTVFSQTTVSSGGIQGLGSGAAPTHDISTASLASIGQYNDFAKGLNQNARPNCRSSVIPKPGGAAYF